MRIVFNEVSFKSYLISPGLGQGCGIHLEVPSIFVFEMMLWTLNIHLNFGGFPDFGRFLAKGQKKIMV